SLLKDINNDSKQAAGLRLDDIHETLESTHLHYIKLVDASMRLLQQETLALGEPRQIGTVNLEGSTVPNLYFGATAMGLNFGLIDSIKSLIGGTATVFTRDNDRYVRISTNVVEHEKRVIGTILDPQGSAIASINKGESYTGMVDILGKAYIARYDPIFDPQKNVIGVWYVGYPVEKLSGLLNRIAETRILDHGFIMLVDHKQQLMACSSNTPPKLAAPMSKVNIENIPLDAKWQTQQKSFDPWHHTIIAATYLPDAFWRTLKVVLPIFLLTALIGIAGIYAQSLALNQARELKEAAEAARASAEQSNRTKSAFLANMSHELRTPLNAIIGYSELLIEEAEDAGQDDLVPDLQKIQSSGQHLLTLINEVLDLSKIEAGKMTLYNENFSLLEMIQGVTSTIQPLIVKNENRLDLDCPADLGSIRADVTKTRQILFNLLSNACKFTHNGTIKLRAIRTGDRIRISVQDSGIGLSPEQQKKLFQEFSQADDSTTKKFGGTGLGLALCKRFALMMEGDITVESEAGKGATFTVELPLTPSGDATAPPAPSGVPLETALPLATSPGQSTVLVVDDEAQSLELMRRHLEKNHFRVVCSSNGEEALALAQKLKPDLITLDVMMPGLDGWSVLTALKNDDTTRDIPVIMVSMVDSKPMALALGAADYVAKPFDRDQIVRLIELHGVKTSSPMILIVDDDTTSYDAISRMLTKDGFRTAYAMNGRSALEMMDELKPDLIILDLMMPEMNGFDFVRELRRREKGFHTPVVVFSARDLSAQEKTILRGTVQETLQKGKQTFTDLVLEVKKRLDIEKI
ncbi:MAG: hypothetical protein RL693_623, partial [Verrucomicrobiota bacterium]